MKPTALITGASRGIGRAAATIFAKRGYNVVINYNKSEAQALALEAELAARDCGAFACRADVTDAGQVRELIRRSLERFGRIDVLVNNAGVAQQKLFTDISEDEWDVMMDVNVKSMYLTCREALPHMISRKSGSIVNVSSIWGITGASCEVHYSATKAAVIGFTKALAKELGPSNIRVNCVAPGVIATDMNAALTTEDAAALCEETPLMRIGTAREAAECIWFLGSEGAAFVTGQVLSPNGGIVI